MIDFNLKRCNCNVVFQCQYSMFVKAYSILEGRLLELSLLR
jgi:hypothetical protein